MKNRLLALLLLTGFLCGCGNNSGSQASVPPSSGSAAADSAAVQPEASPQAADDTDMIDNIVLDSTYPVVKETLSLDIAFVPSDGATNFNVDENWMVAYFDNVTNLDINWILIEPTARKERVTLMLNSGDLPDAIQGYEFSPADIVQYGMGEGMFYPINELVAAYCPTFSALLEEQPAVGKAITCSDGNMYGFPGLPNIYTYPHRFFYNTEWLERVGKEPPETLADLKDLLTAFRDQDANGNGDAADEIPWSGSWNEASSERKFILNAYGYVSTGDNNLAIDYSGGQPVISYMPYASRYKDYLLYMKGLWADGLLDRDMFTQSETQVQATILNGTVGMCAMSAPYVYDPDHQEDWESVPCLVSEKGSAPVWPGPNPTYSTSLFSISASCDPEQAAALANFADGYYTLETYGLLTYGPEAGTELDYYGWGHYYDEEQDTILYNLHPNASGAWNHRTTYLTFWNTPGMVSNGYDPYRLLYAERYPDSAIGKQFKNGVVSRADEVSQQKAYAAYYKEGVPSLFFSIQDLDRINELVVPLDGYVANMEAKFITGELDVESGFDDFISTLESYGVKEYLDIYTRYYEDYKNS